MHTDQAPAIPWHAIIDIPTNQKVGRSMKDEILQVKPETEQWLFKRVWSNSTLKARFTRQNGISSLNLDATAAYQYGQARDRFLELLLFLTHITYGQPARANELLSIRHTNSANGGVRNVFIEQGRVMIVTALHKGYSRSERVKVIHRFLPRPIGTLLVHYIWLVLPFWEALQEYIWEQGEAQDFMWERELEDDSDTGALGDILSGAPMNGKSERCESSDEESDKELQGNAARPAHPGRKQRAGPSKSWSAQRVTAVLRKNSTLGSGNGFTVSSWRHIAKCINRRYLRDGSAMDNYIGEDHSSEGEADDPLDLQSTHTSNVAGNIYGQLMHEGSYQEAQLKRKFMEASTQWHELLGFHGRPVEGNTKAAGDVKLIELGREAQAARRSRLQTIDMSAAVRLMMGPSAELREEQATVLKEIQANKPYIAAIMGTGAGKTMLFMLPAFTSPGGVTVVVAPLVSLKGDIARRCNDAGIPSTEWRVGVPPIHSQIVLVTPKSAMSKAFWEFAQGLAQIGLLDRIVIDECHCILEGKPEYRERLAELGQLGMLGTQMVYLTATLPPTSMAGFKARLGIPQHLLTEVRFKTDRPRIQHRVVAIKKQPGDDFLDTTLDEVERLIEDNPFPARTIIYCLSKDMVDRVAEELGVDAYHSEVATRGAKAERYTAWASGAKRDLYGDGAMIVATNALGLGIDVPGLSLVIHIEQPRTLEDYAQQSGRAGRCEGKAESVIFTNGKTSNPHGDLMKGYLAYTGCRRAFLSQYMDGPRWALPCTPDENPCDNCENTMKRKRAQREAATRPPQATGTAQPDVASIVNQAQAQRTAIRMSEDESLFEEIGSMTMWEFCAACTFITGRKARHRPSNCKDSEAEAAMEAIKPLVSAFNAAPKLKYTYCFTCWTAQDLCDSWERRQDGGWRPS